MKQHSEQSNAAPHQNALAWKLRSDLPLIGYSSGNFGKNLVLSTFDVTFVFVLTDLLRIPPREVGILMLIVVLGDLVFDFVAGYLAAWAGARGFGYRGMIALGALPCAATFTALYSLPALGLRSFAVIAMTLLAFRATYAIIDVPHNVLIARVASDSRARGRASGYRLLFSTLASLSIAAFMIPAVVNVAHTASFSHLAALAASAGSSFCLALWVAAWSSSTGYSVPKQSIVSAALMPKLDGLMLGMFAIALTTGFAMPMFSRTLIYFSTYVLEVPGVSSRLLLALTVGQLPGVILWTYLIRHAEKTQLLAISYIVASIGLLIFAVSGSNALLLTGTAVVIGVGLAGVFMLPWGILADIVDVAEFRHRERRETATFASMLVILKAGAAAGSGVIAFVLGSLGYRVGIEQSAQAQIGIQSLAIGIPLVGAFGALLVLRHLAIGHDRHARIIRVLNYRRSRHKPRFSF
ncbi:GPH family glycoside/pentoside/hexuronide:cation symporter [Novosphingobium sp. SG751A]|uniref:MFS transporter n=1 Tax=Novosphingobium sp. SG751A TaxID=2587000 RepID=UPI001552FDAB|nr:MFS transporter [Novosphingobium sp. SG751A]NOW44995.1 GPH family glycoside/pentoside/hexuronide:cation symporter [Novosphingobium sp. SG751A]